ncbi:MULTISPECIES: helix-turn-helix domain-containing protein [Aeromonas]|uniref:helix-turn-helix domain-containing protein n=1 Tax=Aeromonas TaxID=642 RepID=UPI001CBD8FEA|nr:helix-turn-helix domain-containing protein [Aeromonas enteropelogenes]UAK72114.1 hypothetical protein K8O95_00835 [Aeromonas enteropelogenes]HDO1316012.1 helix-turn-helix transcriptional regulator [Aeromonas veronii]
MKQIIARIKLIDFMGFAEPNADGTKDGWGVTDGEAVAAALSNYISNSPEVDIYDISLEGVRRIDASFPREAFIMLAAKSVGKRGFFVSDVANAVLLDNIRAGADKLSFPLHACCQGRVEVLGPEPKRTQKELYSYVVSKGWVTASEVAEVCNLKINNASNKLKELVDEGFLLRKEGVAETGGIEFYYFPIYGQGQQKTAS